LNLCGGEAGSAGPGETTAIVSNLLQGSLKGLWLPTHILALMAIPTHPSPSCLSPRSSRAEMLLPSELCLDLARIPLVSRIMCRLGSTKETRKITIHLYRRR